MGLYTKFTGNYLVTIITKIKMKSDALYDSHKGLLLDQITYWLEMTSQLVEAEYRKAQHSKLPRASYHKTSIEKLLNLRFRNPKP